MNNIQFTELLGITVLDQADKYIGDIEYMDEISISNTSSKTDLKSGPKMGTLYTIYSEFESVLSGTAVMSVDLLKMFFGIEGDITAASSFLLSNETKAVGTGNKVKLDHEPSTDGRLIVYDVTSGTKTLLEKASGSVTSGKYTISDDEITVEASVKKIKVIYDYSENCFDFGKKPKTNPSMKFYARAKYVDLTSKTEKVGQFEITNGMMSPDFEIKASNSEMAKVDISIACNVDISNENRSWSLKVAA